MALFLQRFTRRKTHGLDENLNEHGGPKLARVLGAFDLVFLGVGSTLGVGVYVLAGEVAKNNAGPAVCISFLIAAFASAFAAVCYAEFGARVPKAGSAYVYSYVTVGELMAFVIGWNLVLEYLIGTASVAKSFSENFDKLVNKSMSNAFLDVFPIDAPGLGPYVDWFAFSVTIVLSGLLAFGMKGSSLFTNVFTVVNLANVLLVIIAGLFFVDGSNWQISFNETDYNETFTEEDVGVGGFAPFGLAGIMDGAATCFFAFVGFDSIAATSEEAKNPKRDIPLAIMTTLVVVFFAYFGVSTVLTLMVPYYLQDPNTPLVSAFFDVGQEELGITVSIGSLFGISASLLGAMIPLPRIIYAMSRDGLVFRILGRIHRQTQTPVLATLLLGLFAAILSMIFDLSALIDMMSIGTLLAYSLVAVSVLIIRFTHDADEDGKLFNSNNERDHKDNSKCLSADFLGSTTNRSQKKAYILIGSYCLLCLGLALILVLGETKLQAGDVGIAVGTAIIAALLAINLAWLAWQPRSKRTVYFMVPLVPLIPCLSILINIYLMMRLSTATWIRFGVWMLVGFLTYFGYGLWFSSEEYIRKGKPVPGSGPLLPVTNGEVNKSFVSDERIEMSSESSTDLEAADSQGVGNDDTGLRKYQTLEALHKADSLLSEVSRSDTSSVDGNYELHRKLQGVFDGVEDLEVSPDYIPVTAEAQEVILEAYKAPDLTIEQQEAMNGLTVMQTALHIMLKKYFSALKNEENPLHTKLQEIFDGTFELSKPEMFIPLPCPPPSLPKSMPQMPEVEIPVEIQQVLTTVPAVHKNAQLAFTNDNSGDALHLKLRRIFDNIDVLSPSPPFKPEELLGDSIIPHMEPVNPVDPEFLKVIGPMIEAAHLTARSYFLSKVIPKGKPNLLPMMHELKSKVVEKPAEDFEFQKVESATLVQPTPPSSPIKQVNSDLLSALKSSFDARKDKEGKSEPQADIPKDMET